MVSDELSKEISHIEIEDKPSKWAHLVEEIESRPNLGDYEEEFRRSQQEFRRNFRFKHDMSEITFILPDSIVEQLVALPDPNEFVSRALADALRRQAETPPPPPEPNAPVPVEIGVPGSLARMRAGEINLLGPFEVPGLPPRLIRVYLPRDYTPERSWFALYMFDGQNVFDDAPSFSGGWHLHSAVERLARAGRPVPVAIGIDHGGKGRNLELSPFGFDFEGEPGQSHILLDWITGSLMPTLVTELNLIPGPLGAVIGGSSMGGLCSLWSHFHYPQAFGGAMVMSPSFWIADQAIFTDIADQPTPEVSRIYLDAGAREDKGRLMPMVAAMTAHLAGRGYDDDRLMFRPDSRGSHNEASWRRRLPKALRFLYR